MIDFTQFNNIIALTTYFNTQEKCRRAIIESRWPDDDMVAISDLPAPSDAVVGDVTGDGVVDIADVNAIINMMLGKVEAVPAADLNGDGNVDISDVNAVINLMLGKVTDNG